MEEFLSFVKVGFRNVGRNKRRSVITIITIFLGVMVVTSIRGLLNGLQQEIRYGLSQKIHGDLQVHKAGYQDNLDANPFKYLIPFDEDMQLKLKGLPGVVAIAPRIRVFGLLNHQKSQTTTPVGVMGFNSNMEELVCPRFVQALQSGSLMESSKELATAAAGESSLEEAKGLEDETNSPAPQLRASMGFHQVLITPSLQRGMGVKLGDEVVLLFQDKNNMQQALVGQVTGVVDYGMPQAAARMVWLDYNTLRDVLSLGENTTEIAFATSSNEDLEKPRAALKNSLGEDFVVETWLELGGLFRDAMGLQNLIFNVVLVIVFVIVVSAIVNTFLMTVMERTKEIGTLMAMGYQRMQILALFLIEAGIIGLIGGVGGLIGSMTLIGVIGKSGIAFRIPGSQIMTVLYPYTTLKFMLFVLALSLFSSVVAGLLPAYRASRMKPVKALASS